MSNIPVRKRLRLPGYDYSAAGTYHVTICTKKREPLFWVNTDNLYSENEIILSEIGKITDTAIINLNTIYSSVSVDNYVVMPDHIHMLISLHSNGMEAPELPMIISQFKSGITRRIGKSIWQRGYNDHVIRNEKDYMEKWRYIDQNPLKYVLKGEW